MSVPDAVVEGAGVKAAICHIHRIHYYDLCAGTRDGLLDLTQSMPRPAHSTLAEWLGGGKVQVG